MIAIVTDSAAYLTHDEAVNLGVVIVPMSWSFADGSSFTEGCLDDGLRHENMVADHIADVHTSQATMNSFLNTFKMLHRSGYEILCLTISSRLSGTYANAVLAARELGGAHIRVVDSLTACSGLYLMICRARERIRSGAGLSDVAEYLNRLRRSVRLCFSVDDMMPLRRSGRLGNVRMSVSTMLNIKPILEIRDGAVVSTGMARGRVDQMNKLCAFCKNASGSLVVDHFLGAEAAVRLAEKLDHEKCSILCRRIGPVLGAHLGRGCVGVAYIEEEKHE